MQVEVAEELGPRRTDIFWVKALKVLSEVQERLDRVAEAKETLFSGLEVLDRRKDKAWTAAAFEANVEADKRWVIDQF